MKKFHNRKGGFTLIELMIVVAIIGILAAIAIPNFLRFQLKAKSSEGKTNLAAIRTAEESYYSEFGVYVSAFETPAAPGKNQKIAFNNTPTNGVDKGFDRLGWSPEGLVYFNYGVAVAGSGYTASAGADIDAIATIEDPAEAEAKIRLGQAVFTDAATLPVPTVAAIEGISIRVERGRAVLVVALPGSEPLEILSTLREVLRQLERYSKMS